MALEEQIEYVHPYLALPVMARLTLDSKVVSDS